jgi:hypothetical protein
MTPILQGGVFIVVLTERISYHSDLGGGSILLRASCAQCAEKTGKVETICLREMFLAYRTHFSLPTWSKKKRPTKLPVLRDYGTRRIRRYVPIEDHPHVLVLPRFMPPRVMMGLPPGPIIEAISYNIFGDAKDIREKVRRLGGMIATVPVVWTASGEA